MGGRIPWKFLYWLAGIFAFALFVVLMEVFDNVYWAFTGVMVVGAIISIAYGALDKWRRNEYNDHEDEE